MTQLSGWRFLGRALMREPTLRQLRHAFATRAVVIVIVALGAVAVLWL
jgi:hypothetical protein